jgi:hypothetical protein
MADAAPEREPLPNVVRKGSMVSPTCCLVDKARTDILYRHSHAFDSSNAPPPNSVLSVGDT